MKRPSSFIAIFIVLVLSFFAGYWYRLEESVKNNLPSRQQSQSLPAVDPSADKATEDDDASSIPGVVQVSPEKQRIMGVGVEAVKKASESHVLRILGRLAADETRTYRINAAVDGWIREIHNDTTGSLVKKNEVLSTFYSPEFLSATQAYIYALGSRDRVRSDSREPPQQLAVTELNLKQYKDSLHNLGMSDVQIDEIKQTRQYTEDIQIRSPATGFVTFRNVTEGLRFEKGTELYRIVDLGRVWIMADIFENEARYFQPGKNVRVLPPQGGKTLAAKVGTVLPLFDAGTRTLKIRLEADNPGYILRPDMFVDVELPITFPPAIVVPASAVLDLGMRKTIFVARAGGYFEPRQVETGWRFGNRVEIVNGLDPGERIVVSGNFLIDSESRMELAASGKYSTLARDPVCGSDVAVKKAEKTGKASVYRGKLYYFSSAECKARFDRNPDRYLEKPVKGND